MELSKLNKENESNLASKGLCRLENSEKSTIGPLIIHAPSA